MNSRKRILWIDCIGALFVGALMLSFCQTLAGWYGLSTERVQGLALVNAVYGSYSLLLAIRQSRSLIAIQILAIANISWFFVCMALVIYWRSEISTLGMCHLIAEGIYVGGLGWVEWKWRKELT